jgi:hypothetical protein
LVFYSGLNLKNTLKADTLNLNIQIFYGTYVPFKKILSYLLTYSIATENRSSDFKGLEKEKKLNTMDRDGEKLLAFVCDGGYITTGSC